MRSHRCRKRVRNHRRGAHRHPRTRRRYRRQQNRCPRKSCVSSLRSRVYSHHIRPRRFPCRSQRRRNRPQGSMQVAMQSLDRMRRLPQSYRLDCCDSKVPETREWHHFGGPRRGSQSARRRATRTRRIRRSRAPNVRHSSWRHRRLVRFGGCYYRELPPVRSRPNGAARIDRPVSEMRR